MEGRKVLWRRINSRRRRRGRRVWCGYGIVCMVIYEGSDYAHGKLFHHFELQRRRFQTSALAQSLLKRSCYLFLLFSSGFFCTLLKKIWDEARSTMAWHFPPFLHFGTTFPLSITQVRTTYCLRSSLPRTGNRGKERQTKLLSPLADEERTESPGLSIQIHFPYWTFRQFGRRGPLPTPRVPLWLTLRDQTGPSLRE